MEDDLKILKMKYLSNHWSELTQIWNLSLGDQSKLYKCFKWRWPPMEEDLRILKVEYLSNHWLDLTQIQTWDFQIPLNDAIDCNTENCVYYWKCTKNNCSNFDSLKFTEGLSTCPWVSMILWTDLDGPLWEPLLISPIQSRVMRCAQGFLLILMKLYREKWLDRS